MTDTILAISYFELVTLIFNAVLFLGMGLAMVFAKQLAHLGARLLDKATPFLFRRSAASSFPTFSLRGHS